MNREKLRSIEGRNLECMDNASVIMLIAGVTTIAVYVILFDGINDIKRELNLLTDQNNKLRDKNAHWEEALYKTLRASRGKTFFAAYADEYEVHQISNVRYQIVKSHVFDTPYRQCYEQKHIIIDANDGSSYIADDIGVILFFNEEEAKKASKAPCQIPGYRLIKCQKEIIYEHV